VLFGHLFEKISVFAYSLYHYFGKYAMKKGTVLPNSSFICCPVCVLKNISE
jgi:hypothetical protein